MSNDELWLAVEEATKDINFDEIKSKFEGTDEAKTLESIKNVRGLIKSFIDTSKMVGDPEKRLPQDDAGWEDFYRRRGKPESPELYNFEPLAEYKLPEDILEPVTKNLYDANLTNEQAVKVVKTFLDLTQEDMNKEKEVLSKVKEEAQKAKSVKYGDKLSEVENKVEAYLGNIENEKVKAQLKSLSDTAEGLEFLNSLASRSYSDDPTGPKSKQPPKGARSAAEQIELLKRDQGFLKKLLNQDQSIPLAERQAAKKLWQDLQVEAVKEKSRV